MTPSRCLSLPVVLPSLSQPACSARVRLAMPLLNRRQRGLALDFPLPLPSLEYTSQLPVGLVQGFFGRELARCRPCAHPRDQTPVPRLTYRRVGVARMSDIGCPRRGIRQES